MTKELAKQDNGLNSLIEQAITNPDVDVAKMQALLDMNLTIRDKQAEINFNQAMSELQPKLPQITKNKKAHNSNYATYEEIDKKIKHLYNDHGFAPSYNTKREEDKSTTYYGTLSHKDGHSRTYEINLQDDDTGSKNKVQAKASTLSYAKRYLLQMMFNVVTTDEDIDGNKLIESEEKKYIKKLIKECDIEEDRFIIKYNITSIDNMPMKTYLKAVQDMRARIANNAKKDNK